MEPKQLILETAKEIGLSMTSEFVPFSQSRNKAEKHPSLNWRVTLFRGHGKVKGGQAILTTDYMAGMAHAPSYKQGDRTVMRDEVVRWECEHGYPGRWFDNSNISHDIRKWGKEQVKPDFADVLSSLVLDANVIDYSTYEEWAPELGLDPDSRKGEAIYRQCLEIALKLRAAIGEAGLAKLAEACRDY